MALCGGRSTDGHFDHAGRIVLVSARQIGIAVEITFLFLDRLAMSNSSTLPISGAPCVRRIWSRARPSDPS
jgi:hypothetical protein